MHRSRLSTFVIDCNVDDLAAAAEFWSKALHRPLAPADAAHPDHRKLDAVEGAPTNRQRPLAGRPDTNEWP